MARLWLIYFDINLDANALESNFKMFLRGMTVSSIGVNGSRLASTRCRTVRGSTGKASAASAYQTGISRGSPLPLSASLT
jgi:hypothetical protein